MASFFGHATAALTAGTFFRNQKQSRFWVTGIVCSILPDADVLAFAFGLPYRHPFGHRGFTHSIAFSILVGIIVAAVMVPKPERAGRFRPFAVYLAVCTFSHALLDAMTNGGLGVAFFWPLDNARYFLPWRPIQVSPIGVSAFFSEWGGRVLLSEFMWIGISCGGLVLLKRLLQKSPE